MVAVTCPRDLSSRLLVLRVPPLIILTLFLTNKQWVWVEFESWASYERFQLPLIASGRKQTQRKQELRLDTKLKITVKYSIQFS